MQNGVELAAGVKLKVGRAGADPNAFTVVGDNPAGPSTASHVDGPFLTRIPVSGGDVIGLSTQGAGKCAKAPSPGDTSVFAAGDVRPGGPTAFTPANAVRLPIEAIVEPDGDNDGFGDLTQDRCPDAAGSVDGCRSSDLSVALTASASSIRLGGAVTYTVRVTNNGPDPAPDVVLTNTPPGGLPTTMSLGAIGSGQTASKAFLAKPTAAGPAVDTASVPTTDDPDATNNTASSSVAVIAPPPMLSHLTQAHRRWRASLGTTFKFVLDRPARVVLRFTQRGKALGTLSVQGHAGANKVRFRGRLAKRRKLGPGGYVLKAGVPGSGAKRLRFTIVR